MGQTNKTFKEDILFGLTKKTTKTISSQYFYNAIGDQIFQEIMNLDEYYLTSCELNILKQESKNILNLFPKKDLSIIELGAGDGKKTKYLLKQCLLTHSNIDYIPIDISPDILQQNKTKINQDLPQIKIKPEVGEYLAGLKNVQNLLKTQLVLCLGSNIGNFSKTEAPHFLNQISSQIKPNDFVLVGFDLKKNPQTILNAYNDSEGVTKRFNLNLLQRINTELNANFQIEKFDHYAIYDPITGTASSFLTSLIEQMVCIENTNIEFKSGEVIHTETSQKYNSKEIKDMCSNINLKIEQTFFDSKKYYSLVLFKKEEKIL